MDTIHSCIFFPFVKYMVLLCENAACRHMVLNKAYLFLNTERYALDTIRRLKRDCEYAQTRLDSLLSPERRAPFFNAEKNRLYKACLYCMFATLFLTCIWINVVSSWALLPNGIFK